MGINYQGKKEKFNFCVTFLQRNLKHFFLPNYLTMTLITLCSSYICVCARIWRFRKKWGRRHCYFLTLIPEWFWLDIPCSQGRSWNPFYVNSCRSSLMFGELFTGYHQGCQKGWSIHKHSIMKIILNLFSENSNSNSGPPDEFHIRGLATSSL